MKKTYCDVCGKEIGIGINNGKSIESFKNIYYGFDDEPIADMCEECYMTIYCCLRMMKKTKWKPDFHKVLRSDDAGTREIADWELSDLKSKTGLDFFNI